MKTFIITMLLLILTCSKTPTTCPSYDHPVETSAETFDEDIKECSIVLVYVGADWCPPCRAIKPVLYAKAKQYSGIIKILYLNADKTDRHEIEIGNGYIPFFRLYIDGEIKYEGGADADYLTRMINGAVISKGFKE